MDRIDYLVDSPMGLGSSISLLSLLLDTKVPVKLTYSTKLHALTEIKKLFQIPDEVLEITEDFSIQSETDSNKRLGDYCKFFSPYIKHHEFRRFRQSGLPCIALVCVNGNLEDWNFSLDNHTFPFNKFYPKAYWLKLMNLILDSGYEVMTINSEDISLNQKINILSEYCDAVIGYEGGLHHLSHCLNIPSIIVPWRMFPLTEWPTPPEHFQYTIHQLHIDKRTWILDSSDELLNYAPNGLRLLIDSLYDNRGNNMYLSGKLQLDTSTMEFMNHDQSKYTNYDHYGPYLSDFEKNFIKNHGINVARQFVRQK